MQLAFAHQPTADALPVVVLDPDQFDDWRITRSAAEQDWLALNRFQATPGTTCVLPGADGKPAMVLAGARADDWLWSIAAVPGAVGPARCRLDNAPDTASAQLAALGYGLAAYRFQRYGKPDLDAPQLVLPDGVDRAALEADIRAITLARDLINTPAADMMPEHLCAAVSELATRRGAQFTELVGDALLADNYPTVHAVGRASTHAPRLAELTWGEPDAPRVTIIGKGVCFDSGGLDIKPAAGMRLMKKDMGGAAHAIGLASRILDAGLPVHLRLLVPAVENAISGNAMRPGDVITTRAGKTVEIDNTDAEGRLILCDALTAACEARPELIVDFATLTGAARVALGTDLPALFCNDDRLAGELTAAAVTVADPLWRMPLHAPYRELLESRVADMVNSAGGPYAGAITAALYLESFVEPYTPWAHFDLMAWNQRARPGRPEGGEAMALRAVFHAIAERHPRR